MLSEKEIEDIMVDALRRTVYSSTGQPRMQVRGDWVEGCREAAAAIAAAHAAEMEEMREAIRFVREEWFERYYPSDVFTGVSGDEGVLDVIEIKRRLDEALAATPKRVRWMETFSLNDQGHIFVRAQTGYDDDWQYWFDDFLEPGQSVAVAVWEGKMKPSECLLERLWEEEE